MTKVSEYWWLKRWARSRQSSRCWLVLAHGDEVGVVKQDVRGHQHGVAEQTGVDRGLSPGPFVGKLDLAVGRVGLGGLEAEFGGLVLELGHALELPDGGQAGQHPGEFGVPDNVRLEELVAFVGIKTAGNVLGHALVGVLPENRGFGGRGDGVQIDDPEVAFVPVEHFRPVAHRSEVVAQGEIARGLGAGQDDRFRFAQ